MKDNPQRKARQHLLEQEMERIVEQIKHLCPQKIILFGSLARGEVGRYSDLDLIVIKQTKKRFSRRLDEFYDHLDIKIGVDLLVYTPAEIERMKENNPFIQRALKEGRVIYEAKVEE